MPRRELYFMMDALKICRLCLRETRDLVDVLEPNEPYLKEHVLYFFKVEIKGNDGKSSKICQNCIRKIHIWQGQIERAHLNQCVVDYLANKNAMLLASQSLSLQPSIQPSIQPLSVPNKKRKTTSRRSNKRKSTSLIPEIPSTSNNMIQLPLESIQPSTSASIYQFPSINIQYGSDVPSTSKSTSTEIIPIASTSAEFISSTSTSTEIIPIASTSAEFISSTSTSTEIIPIASTSAEFISSTSTSTEIIPIASTSAEFISSTSTSTKVIPFASSSAEVIPFASTSAKVIPFPSTSVEVIPFTSTSAEVIPFASTSAEVIPFASTSAEVIPFASTSAEVIPFASTSAEVIPFASTSAEVIPFASTSAEVIPFASSSSSSSIEIVPSYTINEISSTGHNPVWYPNGNEKTDPESEVDDKNKSCIAECVCIFCTYQHEEVSRNAYNHILFCSKHSQPYACLIENCHSVFPNKLVFIQHYRTHLNLNNSTYLCHKCFSVLTCPRRTVMTNHTHQNLSEMYKCCSLTFTTMTKLVLHKLINHCAIVVTSHNRTRTHKKLNLDIKKTELEDIKVGLDVPGTEPCKQKIKDNGSIKCYRCPKYFNNIVKFIEHSKIKHKNLITAKDKEIKLCPLCNKSYFNEQFTEHLENCTNTMLVGDKSLNHYGCVYCSAIFTNLSTREFRNHVLYCKSFELGIVSNKINHKCLNCNFTSTNDYLSLVHANSNCISFQLKMRYAMGPDEKNKVTQQLEFAKQNIEQQDKDGTNDGELLSSSKTYCNTARQRLLKMYNFFCNNCENLFFDEHIFFKHLTETGSYCRLQNLIYCQKCLTEFNSMEEYEGHLPRMPEATPILLTVKEELISQNNYEYGDHHLDVVRFNPNYGVVKVERNNETLHQKQEPIDETDYNIDIMQEQEVSYNYYNNSVFSCPEMDLPNNDIDMHWEVEEKVDLNSLLKNPE